MLISWAISCRFQSACIVARFASLSAALPSPRRAADKPICVARCSQILWTNRAGHQSGMGCQPSSLLAALSVLISWSVSTLLLLIEYLLFFFPVHTLIPTREGWHLL